MFLGPIAIETLSFYLNKSFSYNDAKNITLVVPSLAPSF